MSETLLLVKSSEGTSFKVPAFQLKACSAVFRNLFDLKEDPEDPIVLEYPSSVVSYFIQLLDFDKKLDALPFNGELLTGLVTLALEFDIGLLAERVALRLHKLDKIPTTSAWMVFCLASHLKDERLARRAIASMDAEKWLWDGEWTEERVRGATVKYHIALFRACHATGKDLRSSGGYYGQPQSSHSEDVAKNFFVT